MTTSKDETLTARAFVPGHVTGLFRIHDECDELLQCGSTGAGFSVAIGTVTTVSVMEHSELEITTDYNNERIDAQVTKTVVRRLANEFERKVRVHVSHDSSLVSGAGFGASGAGALGTALALSHIIDSEMPSEKAAQYAHCAEIINRTGLGDVFAQTIGGVEIRVKPGGPGVGKITPIPYDKSLRVILAGAPGLKTPDVLSSETYRTRINTIGDKLVDRIIAKPTIRSLIQCAREFSDAIGLKTERVESALMDLDAAGFEESSMVMLGDSVFCFCDEQETLEVEECLSRHWDPSQVLVSGIAETGGMLL
ncbi:MAG: pantoate kinase [Promethearchaeota archaeon]